EGVAGFGVVEGDGGVVTAALGGVGFVVFVGGEVFEAGEEEGAEFSLCLVDGGEGVFFEEAGEEALDEVFGFGGVVAVAAEPGVEGEPVGLCEVVEGAAGGFGGGAFGGEDEGPAGGGEVGGGGHWWNNNGFEGRER